jgi:hypothetical protein
MDASDLLAARADQIIDTAMVAMAARRFVHYERMGQGAAAGKLRELLDHVIDGARTRSLVHILAYAEQIGNDRCVSGFELVEVQGAFNLLEESIWLMILAACPPAEQGAALGLVATLLGAAKDKLASTYLSLATATHVPSLDLASLFRGTQNTGGGANDP